MAICLIVSFLSKWNAHSNFALEVLGSIQGHLTA